MFSFLNTWSDFLTVAVVPALLAVRPFTPENDARNTLGRPLADCHTENGLISYPRRKKQSRERPEVAWKSDSFSYRAHLPFDSQVATLPLTPAQGPFHFKDRRVLTAWTNSHVAFRGVQRDVGEGSSANLASIYRYTS